MATETKEPRFYIRWQYEIKLIFLSGILLFNFVMSLIFLFPIIREVFVGIFSNNETITNFIEGIGGTPLQHGATIVFLALSVIIFYLILRRSTDTKGRDLMKQKTKLDRLIDERDKKDENKLTAELEKSMIQVRNITQQFKQQDLNIQAVEAIKVFEESEIDLDLAINKISATLPDIEKEKKIEARDRNTFGITGGAIRALLAITLVIIFIFTMASFPQDWEDKIPLTIIISLNVALIYYGIKPENVLPTFLVKKDEEIEEPTHKSLIKNFPSIYDFINNVQQEVSDQFKSLKLLAEKINNEITSQMNYIKIEINHVGNALDQKRDEAKNILNKARGKVENQHTAYLGQVEVVKNGINRIKPSTQFKNPLDVLAFSAIALLISIIVVTFPEINQDFAIEVVLGSSFAVLAATAGGLLQQTIFFSPFKCEVEKIFDNLTNELNNIETTVEIIYEGTFDQFRNIEESVDKISNQSQQIVNDTMAAINTIDSLIQSVKMKITQKLDEFQKRIDQQFESFWKSNFLDSLPQDLSAIVTIFIISVLFYIIILPQSVGAVPDVAYALILWLFSYYFATKK